MWLYVLILPLVIVALVLLWLGVTLALSHVGGWSVLAESYPARPQPAVTDLGTASLMLDRGFMVVKYNRSVHLTLSPEGLGMETYGLFHRGHPPVLIPWAEVESCERQRLLFGEAVALTLRSHKVNILINGPEAEAVLAAWAGHSRPGGIP